MRTTCALPLPSAHRRDFNLRLAASTAPSTTCASLPRPGVAIPLVQIKILSPRNAPAYLCPADLRPALRLCLDPFYRLEASKRLARRANRLTRKAAQPCPAALVAANRRAGGCVAAT